MRDSIAELDPYREPQLPRTTALKLADILASRGAYEQAARWCAEVRQTLNGDDLTDAIAVDSLEGFFTAVAGSHAEGERLSSQAVRLAATTDMYELHIGVGKSGSARTLALVRQAARGT